MFPNNKSRRLLVSGLLTATLCCAIVLVSSSIASAVPYASGISQSGTTVTYVLNEDADSITVKRTNDSDLILSDPNDLLRGTHTFDLGGLATGFSVEVSKSTTEGWTQINDPTSEVTSKYYGPRGVAVNQNPSSPYFGMIYVSETTPGTTGGDPNTTIIRTTQASGIFAIKADRSDVLGQGDVPADGGLFIEFGNDETPYKLTIAPDDTVYMTGYANAAPGVWQAPADLSGFGWSNVLANDSCSATGLCTNHGNVFSAYVEGTGAGTTLYTMDEDYPDETGFFGPSRGDILKYDIGSTTDYSGLPSLVVDDGHDPNGDGGISGKIIGNPSDFVRDADGTWWIAQYRSDDSFAYPNLTHWADDPNASGPLWQSGKENRTPGDVDWDTDIDGADFLIMQRNFGLVGATAYQGDTNGDMDVDPNDLATWEAGYGKQKQVGQLVLQNVYGNLDIHNGLDLLVMGTRFGTDVHVVDISDPNKPVLQADIPHGGGYVNDVAFDIAGNIYAVSRSTETLRIFSPGGDYVAITGSDGSFSLVPGGAIAAVPEPATILSGLALSLVALSRYRSRRQLA